ncbi:MAG: hypothetical protein R3C16_03735 [Hyphomonadaceae bacterium]
MAARSTNSTHQAVCGDDDARHQRDCRNDLKVADAPLGFLFNNTVTMRHDAYRRSRLVDPILRVA